MALRGQRRDARLALLIEACWLVLRYTPRTATSCCEPASGDRCKCQCACMSVATQPHVPCSAASAHSPQVPNIPQLVLTYYSESGLWAIFSLGGMDGICPSLRALMGYGGLQPLHVVFLALGGWHVDDHDHNNIIIHDHNHN